MVDQTDSTRALVLSGGASHGAFQAGVFQALEEIGWTADIVFGSSVGAINGAAYLLKDAEEVADIWKGVSTDNVYQMRPWHDWLHLWTWQHLVDTSPLRAFLDEHLEVRKLYDRPEVFACVGTDVKTGWVRLFSNHIGRDDLQSIQDIHDLRRVDLDAIMASASIPGIFPWVHETWDGSFQYHTPLKPAVALGADEIVIVHLELSQREGTPQTMLETAMRVIDVTASYRYLYDLEMLRDRNAHEDYRTIRHAVVSPTHTFSYSRLDFDDDAGKTNAIEHGYNRTYEVLHTTDGFDDHL